MTPFLTWRGRWLLISGTIFLLMGAVFSAPLVLFLGQVQIALLAIAFMLLVPASIALDRRRVRLVLEDDEGAGGRALVVGRPATQTLRLVNASGAPLHALRVTAFAAPALASEPVAPVPLLPARSSLRVPLEVCAQRAGRWALHGFDVRVRDPLGLIETRDYLPCVAAFSCYPEVVRQRRVHALPAGGLARREGGRHLVAQLGVGTDVRELREHQPGDPLRHIAWKATVRRGKLVSKNYEHETSLSVYLLLDISSSMRGGQHPGQKLDFAISQLITLADQILRQRDSVGLMTFDEKLYGHVPAASNAQQLRRLLNHLVGLSAVVDPDLTELDEQEVEALLVDYLLIQERLDFRKGEEVDPDTGLNHALLRRWLTSVLPQEARAHQDATIAHDGARGRVSPARAFARLRGLLIPYRVEARLGLKERGLTEALETLVATTRGRHQLLIYTDLCGVMNLDLLTRGVRLAQLKGHRLRFIVPFTPAFYDDGPLMRPEKYQVLRGLFTHAEREERMRVVKKLRALGVEVELTAPVSARALVLSRDPSS